jgi:hypothetical protein
MREAAPAMVDDWSPSPAIYIAKDRLSGTLHSSNHQFRHAGYV